MSALDRVQVVEQNLAQALHDLQAGPARERTEPIRDGVALSIAEAAALFAVQLTSRQLDYAARALKNEGKGFYTIASAGHEGNAAVAAALRVMG